MNLRIIENTRDYGTKPPVEWHSLEEEEQVAIWMYTKQYFRFWNAALYSGNMGKIRTHAAAIELFKCGLAKLPNHAGRVVRGEATYSSRHDAHIVGADFDVAAFWSTTYDERVLTKTGQFGGDVKYIVGDGHTGKLIDFVSESPAEREVIFMPGSKFNVTARTGDHARRQVVEIAVKRIP